MYRGSILAHVLLRHCCELALLLGSLGLSQLSHGAAGAETVQDRRCWSLLLLLLLLRCRVACLVVIAIDSLASLVSMARFAVVIAIDSLASLPSFSLAVIIAIDSFASLPSFSLAVVIAIDSLASLPSFSLAVVVTLSSRRVLRGTGSLLLEGCVGQLVLIDDHDAGRLQCLGLLLLLLLLLLPLAFLLLRWNRIEIHPPQVLLLAQASHGAGERGSCERASERAAPARNQAGNEQVRN